MNLILPAVKLSLAGACIYLDRTHALQIMISRPIVVGPIMGFLAGDVVMGLFMGAIIELLWIRDIPVGTVVPPDETTMAILVSSVAVLDFHLPGKQQLALSVYALILFLPAPYISPRIELLLRGVNNRLWRIAWRDAEKGKTDRVPLYHFAGAAIAFVVHAAMLFAFLMGGLQLIQLTFPLLPKFVTTALVVTGCISPAIGIAASLSNARGRWALVLFSLSFLLLFVIFR